MPPYLNAVESAPQKDCSILTHHQQQTLSLCFVSS
jgi:hypothetical protein